MKSKTNIIIGLGMTALVSAQETPYTLEDGAEITLSGRVTEVAKETFVLDYGKGDIIVEVDDTDWYSEMPELKVGEKVTVFGKIDSDRWQSRSIEAGYVKTDAGIAFASSQDEEDFQYPLSPIDLDTVNEESLIEVKGYISNKNGKEFTLSFEGDFINVDLDEMKNPPLNEKGELLYPEGLFISVIGFMDRDLLEEDEVKAETIITF